MTSQEPIIAELKQKANAIYSSYLLGQLTYEEAIRESEKLDHETTKAILTEVITKVRSL